MKDSEIYFRFLALTNSLNTNLTSREVDLSGQKLLEAIAVAASRECPLTVTEAMSLVNIASPATLHRKIRSLKDAGLVTQSLDDCNRKTRLLMPTAKADRYFSSMGKYIASSLVPGI